MKLRYHYKHSRASVLLRLTRIVILLGLVVLALVVFANYKVIMPRQTTADIKPLTATEQKIAERLRSDVFVLADEIGERSMFNTGSMEQALSWIKQRLAGLGFSPQTVSYQVEYGPFAGSVADNIVVEVLGVQRPDRIVLIGAHYDSVIGSPGANDNASGVAVLLALAEWFIENPQALTVRFVFFANEEPPFFYTRNMGSFAYARQAREKGEHIEAMIALDGLGYFSDDEGSQRYPIPGLGFYYPRQANFIGFVTRLRDRSLLLKALSAFRSRASICAEGASLPGFLPGVFWSDHWSFWKHEYSAFLVTDTLLFRYPYYHTADDTADRLDYQSMARVSSGLIAVIEALSSLTKHNPH